MKCLCVSQPFADLIVAGRKIVELRSWNTSFRGEFLVHAPLKIWNVDAKRLKIDKKFVTGAIIGKAELYQVKKYGSVKEIKADQKFHFSLKQFQKNVFGFMLKNAEPYKIPIPCKGRLGFFDVDVTETSTKDKEIMTEIFDEEYRYQWVGHH